MDSAPATMRALMLVAERRLEVVDLPIPDLPAAVAYARGGPSPEQSEGDIA